MKKLKMNKLLGLSVLALLILSCSESPIAKENHHDIAIEDGYIDFSQATLTAKGIVQEVLIAAYKNPELTDFGSDYVSNRNDCPLESDLHPNAFPKTLRYDYGDETCLTESGANMVGMVEVTVSDKLGTPGMTIMVNPLDNFSKDGKSAKLIEDENSIFIATFKSDTDLTNSYDLSISGLEVTDENGNVATIKSLENAIIGFNDVDKNNEDPNAGPSKYIDDLAIINFDKMELINHNDELLDIVVRNQIEFDFSCKCPLAGSVEIENQSRDIQYINYNSNEECSRRILVDTEEIDC